MAAPFDDESFVPAQGPAVRVQILATEHWGLLAARSMTWSEVMSRITIHLTVASAALVVLALVVQSSGFGTGFHVLSIGLAAVVLILGTLTGVRVRSASIEDRAAVIGMNRLRAAYVSLDPTLADYLVTSWHDDLAGVMRTTTLGTPRHPVAHVLGSTNLFMTAVNTIVAGTLGALIASAAGGNATLITVAGLVAAIAYLAAMLYLARRSFGVLPLPSQYPPHATAGDPP
jgi:hypothetical protein